MELVTTSGISATQASTQGFDMALSLWGSAGQPLVLTLPRRRKGRDWMRTGKLGVLAGPSGRGIRLGQCHRTISESGRVQGCGARAGEGIQGALLAVSWQSIYPSQNRANAPLNKGVW